MRSVADLIADVGMPYVDGDFCCSDSWLTSLIGSPYRVTGFCTYSYNQLTSLENAPSIIDGSFYCSENKLTSLVGIPSNVGGLVCCIGNELTSLKDIHKQIHKMNGKFHAYKNPIKSHVLGLLLIEGISEILLDNEQVQEILNSHLGKGRAGMLMAQEELIEAGLEEFAQL